MTIEQAIQQKTPFKNEWHRAMVNLMFTSNWIGDQVKSQLKSYDITPQQYNVLRILRGAGGPISTSDIRDRLLDKMADASRMVERLCQKKLVERNVCPADKRLVDVVLTEAGARLLTEIDQHQEMLGSPLNTLSEEEANKLNELLDKIRQ